MDSKQSYDKKYYQKHRSKKDAYRKQWIVKNQDRVHNYRLKYSYGITNLEYDRLYQIQLGKCAVCKKHQTELKTRLCVDHDHKTGKIRGLLCRRCNLVLGVYENYKLDFSSYLGG